MRLPTQVQTAADFRAVCQLDDFLRLAELLAHKCEIAHLNFYHAVSIRSMSMAMPCPVPMQSVASPKCPLVRANSWTSVTIMRAPVAPSG